MTDRESPSVGILIVNWNGKKDTLACLASLGDDLYPNKTILVVDNGSEDSSAEAIRSAFPTVPVLETGENLGFTGGNNAGIASLAEQGAEYIYLLNSDTRSEPTALRALMTAATQPETRFRLWVPVIYYDALPQRCWFAGSTLDLRRGTAAHDNRREPALGEAPFEIPWASGCAMLLRTDVLLSLGGFDDRYYLYWEDVDLSLRLREAGGTLGMVPSARIYHRVGSAAEKIGERQWYYHVRNNLLFLRLHAGKRYKTALLSTIRRSLRESFRDVRHRKPNANARMIAALQAIRDHSRGRYGPYGVEGKL